MEAEHLRQGGNKRLRGAHPQPQQPTSAETSSSSPRPPSNNPTSARNPREASQRDFPPSIPSSFPESPSPPPPVLSTPRQGTEEGLQSSTPRNSFSTQSSGSERPLLAPRRITPEPQNFPPSSRHPTGPLGNPSTPTTSSSGVAAYHSPQRPAGFQSSAFDNARSAFTVPATAAWPPALPAPRSSPAATFPPTPTAFASPADPSVPTAYSAAPVLFVRSTVPTASGTGTGAARLRAATSPCNNFQQRRAFWEKQSAPPVPQRSDLRHLFGQVQSAYTPTKTVEPDSINPEVQKQLTPPALKFKKASESLRATFKAQASEQVDQAAQAERLPIGQSTSHPSTANTSFAEGSDAGHRANEGQAAGRAELHRPAVEISKTHTSPTPNPASTASAGQTQALAPASAQQSVAPQLPIQQQQIWLPPPFQPPTYQPPAANQPVIPQTLIQEQEVERDRFGQPLRTDWSILAPAAVDQMDRLRPESAAALTAHRREAIRLAKAQERAVVERCKRSGQEMPHYNFDELIGKGSFGRVYKGRQTATSQVVAIKVLDIDDADFHTYGEQKDEQIRDFNREIRILRQAQESGAVNLNPMIEALPVHSQLWLICEYCPGGSVKTLMRATNDRLAEKYIIVVARELGKALQGLHKAGIMHRDVKAANVLIHEEGRLQLCDFGVANVLDTRTDKRRTFIGTLHWMPPELWTEKPEYSDEVDVWEYGCTLYECALGRPPNSDLRERQQLKMRMRRLKQAISLPDTEEFSEGLKSLVKFTLSPEVTSRPSMKDVLEHDYLADTEESHPTSILTDIVQTYYTWLLSGGQRVSLFMPGGAAAAATEDPDAEIKHSDEWNFSMTQDFERRLSTTLEIPDFEDLIAREELEDEPTPKGLPPSSELSPPKGLTAAQKANFEARVNRGGADLSNLFDQSKPAYQFKTKTDFIPIPEPRPEQRRTSDLPFRAMAEERPSSIASNVIDLGDFDEADYAAAAPRTDDNIQTAYAETTPMKEQTIRLADAATLRQKRADSKGPRDSSTQSLTARRASSADDAGRRPSGTAAYDFAAAQQEWLDTKEKTKAPELQEAAEIMPSQRPGHATMDWSFADAMKGLAGDPSPRPELPPSEPTKTDQPDPEDSADFTQKAKARATLDWSFSDAMQELNDTAPASATHTTPSRPTPLLRQMTMPVSSSEFKEAEELPRPATALSEAYSESSASSADIDPFALEQASDDYPGPAALDELGMSQFYASRGRQLLPGDDYSAPPPGDGVAQAYPFGRPPRLDDEDFPGPRAAAAAVSGPAGTVQHERGGSGSALRGIVDVPETFPPSLSTMGGGATNEMLERELNRLLGDLQGTLTVAGEVVGRRERAWETEEGEDGSSE